MMPSDQGDEIGAPQLCPFCIERLKRAAEHGHVDDEWATRAANDFARQCCTNGRTLR